MTGIKKYNKKRRPRNNYPFKYIEELRDEVAEVYKEYEQNIVLKRNKTRDSECNKILLKKIEDKARKELTTASIVEFFTKEPFSDEKGNKWISYEVYTIEAFEKFVKPNNDVVQPDIINDLDDETDNAIKELLNELYLRNKSISTVETTITIEENGFGTLRSSVFIQTLSEIMNLRVQCFSDAPIKVKSKEAFETMSKKKLSLYTYEETETSYFGFIIIPNVLPANSNFYYTYSLGVEDYYIGLIQNKFLTLERFIVPHKYKSIVESHRFPDTDFFRGLKFKVTHHPNTKLINKEIKPTYKDGYKIYTVDFGDLSNIDVLIKFEITID